MAEFEELELRISRLENKHEANRTMIELAAGVVNELKTWREQFKTKNGHGLIPEIIDGVTAKFDKMFSEFKKERDDKFKEHIKEIDKRISLIPCTKLIGDGCLYKIISKNEPVPKGWKEIKSL
jgi:biotin-(acetyl-CoA carboxylase) ligase